MPKNTATTPQPESAEKQLGTGSIWYDNMACIRTWRRTPHGARRATIAGSSRSGCDKSHVVARFFRLDGETRQSCLVRAPERPAGHLAQAVARIEFAGTAAGPDHEVDAAGVARASDAREPGHQQTADAAATRRLANVEILEEQAAPAGPARENRMEQGQAQRLAGLLGDEALAGPPGQAARIVLGPAEGRGTLVRGVLGDQGRDQGAVRGLCQPGDDLRHARAQPAAPAGRTRPEGSVVAVRMLSAMTAGTRTNTAPGWPASSMAPTAAGVSVAPRSRPE